MSVQIPPDSTGAKLGTIERRHLGFDNNITLPQIGDLVVGAASGAFGTVTSVITEGYTAGSGEYHLKDFSGTTFTDNEAIEVSATPISNVAFEVKTQQDIHYQQMTISDPDNPGQIQKIDRFGATVNTFTDGAPKFTPFSEIQVGQTQLIREYRFPYGTDSALFYDNLLTGSTITHESDRANVVLTNPTTSGALAQRTTNFYHPHYPGIGNQVELVVQVGDIGKANVVRRWGVYDDNNGFYWELDNTTLSVVVRSDSTGSIVNTITNQSDFNLDKLDGSDSIGFTLDVSNGHAYFIEYAGAGTGKVRFGVATEAGENIVAHEYTQIGNLPYIRTTSLPLRVEQENTAGSGSSSEFRVNTMLAEHTSIVHSTGQKFSTASALATITQASGEIPIFSIRPKATFGGIANHAIIKGISLNCMNIGNTGDSPVVFKVRMVDDSAAILTGESFASHLTISTAEIDTSASSFTDSNSSITALQIFVAADTSKFLTELSPKLVHSFEINLSADESTQPCFLITAECLTGTNADVMVGLNWEELII